MLKGISIVIFALLSTEALATANIICVMVFNQQGMAPCDRGLPGFASVVNNAEPDRKICTREYEDKMCKDNKDAFYHAKRRGGGRACVLNFFQQVTGNPCSRNDEGYAYVSEPWE